MVDERILKKAEMLREKEKRLLVRFHFNDATMYDCAKEMRMPERDAHEVYKVSIKNILKEWREQGKFRVLFKDEDKEPNEPPVEPVNTDNDDNDKVKDEDEQKPADEDKDEDDEDAETDEASSVPEVDISKRLIKKITTADIPVIFEEDDYSDTIVKHIVGDKCKILKRASDKLPDYGIATEKTISKLKSPFIYVASDFDEDTNTISINVEKLNIEQ